jgi:DNA polymerase III subunit epsilon
MFSFVAFDTETATNHPASICQIGFVVVRDSLIIDERSYLIQPPGNEYNARNSCIHGIDSLQTIDKPLFPVIWEMIKLSFIGKLLVAHNASFDLNILNSTMEFYSMERPLLSCDCTFKMSGLNLKDLAASLNISMTKHHDALIDAKTCALVYLYLKQGIKPNLDLIEESEPSGMFAGHERLSGDVLIPNLNIQNINNPFYSKKVVFTGVLQNIKREVAAKKIQELGADIDTGVNKRTDFVIVGQGAGPSKLKKIQDFNSSGSHIRIIKEEEFLSMIKSY